MAGAGNSCAFALLAGARQLRIRAASYLDFEPEIEMLDLAGLTGASATKAICDSVTTLSGEPARLTRYLASCPSLGNRLTISYVERPSTFAKPLAGSTICPTLYL